MKIDRQSINYNDSNNPSLFITDDRSTSPSESDIERENSSSYDEESGSGSDCSQDPIKFKRWSIA